MKSKYYHNQPELGYLYTVEQKEGFYSIYPSQKWCDVNFDGRFRP